MKAPERLQTLLDQGVIESVVRPLLAGKEAEVYLVEASGELRVAKVYKDAKNRSFKHRADYEEGRKIRNTRTQRAMAKRSRFGRQQLEESWRNAEVDVIYRLHEAGVRVPTPYDYVDSVLIMELVRDEDGGPAPRLVDIDLDPDDAEGMFAFLIREVVRMLCTGVVHGDLSDFNILIGPDGPVIIDFPQAVDPAANRSARKLLIRDVNNLTSFFARHSPELKKTRYAQEMWALYESGSLEVDTKLTGKFKQKKTHTDTDSLLAEIEAVEIEAAKRREALGLPPPRRARAPVVFEQAPEPAAHKQGEGKRGKGRRRRGRGRAGDGPKQNAPQARPEAKRAAPPPAEDGPSKPSKRRRRRRKKKGPGVPGAEAAPTAAAKPLSISLDDLDQFLDFGD